MKRREDILALAQIEEGVPIWGTLPGSPAAEAGLRYGDIVLSIGGERVRSVQEFAEVQRTRAEPYEVVVWREGETLTFVLRPRSFDGDFEQTVTEVVKGRYFSPVQDPEGEKPN